MVRPIIISTINSTQSLDLSSSMNKFLRSNYLISIMLGRWEPSSNQKGQKWDVFENRSKSLPQYKSTGKWEIQSFKPRTNTLSPISTRQNSIESDALVLSLVWSCLYTFCQWLLISSFRPLQSNMLFHHLD